ncbi:MAG: pirin family protein [Myxococcota bacterium]
MLTRRHLLLSSTALAFACTRKSSTLAERGVAGVFASQPTRDGAGVALRRALGHRGLGMFDPFLMLDEFRSDDPNDYLAGFPDHPHRGFETVTWMLEGAMEHRDSVGNHGRLGPGAAQWMTAGRGIVHSEMPKQERGLMWGFQLWVNLPAAKKFTAPRYQDVPPASVPRVALEQASLRVIAGTAEGQPGPVTHIDVEPLFVDLSLEGGRVSLPLQAGHNAFLYVADGAVHVGPQRTEVAQGSLATLTRGEVLHLEGHGHALVFAGRPLGEPVARWGPFVMNTDDELRQAIDDYRSGRLVQPG